jgi:hydrogenase nickel incorporation protein HypA/HybF
MHEMGIALQIVEIATASIPSDLAEVRIERVNLKVGKLAAVVPESLRFCFSVASKDTALDGAELLEILSGRELDIESIEIAEEVKNGSGK